MIAWVKIWILVWALPQISHVITEFLLFEASVSLSAKNGTTRCLKLSAQWSYGPTILKLNPVGHYVCSNHSAMFPKQMLQVLYLASKIKTYFILLS